MNNEIVYNAAYFIAKFEAIPEELWTDKGWYEDGERRCAIGHCGAILDFNNPEAVALRDIASKSVRDRCATIDINDGDHPKYRQETARQRILAWLRDAKEAGL